MKNPWILNISQSINLWEKYEKYLKNLNIFYENLSKIFQLNSFQKIDFKENFLQKNISFYKYIDFKDEKNLKNYFFEENKNFNFFHFYDFWEIFFQDKSLLEKIFYWDFCIIFFDNFSKIAVLFPDNFIKSKVENILLN